MSEAAPLTSAHAHARRAAEETQQIHWGEAAVEHTSAATDLARAARTTTDSEVPPLPDTIHSPLYANLPKALRILGLLEQQHRKLARLISIQDAAPEIDALPEDTGIDENPATANEQQESKPLRAPEKTPQSSQAKPTTTALVSARMGSQARESSPSLARDIASRRGIPLSSRTQPSPAAQARARQLSPESHRRARNAAPPKLPPSIMDSQANLRTQRIAKKTEDDEGFAKFYTSLTTGAASKLSSVLAYAGLPLTADEAQPEPKPNPKTKHKSVPSGSDPDVKRYFSRAALQAIEDEHRQKGTLGHGFGPAESFYVVPQGGGSYTYADITKNRLQAAASSFGEDDDDFVDASETPGPPSPKHSRMPALPGGKKRNAFGKQRTHEELDLENATLKLTLEQLASRLANFEAHAQDASMAALTQSMMSARPLHPGAQETALQERVRQLEQHVDRQTEGEQKLREQTDEQKKLLKGWETKYAKLKVAAREKQKARRDAAEKTGKVLDEGDAEPTEA